MPLAPPAAQPPPSRVEGHDISPAEIQDDISYTAHTTTASFPVLAEHL